MGSICPVSVRNTQQQFFFYTLAGQYKLSGSNTSQSLSRTQNNHQKTSFPRDPDQLFMMVEMMNLALEPEPGHHVDALEHNKDAPNNTFQCIS